MSDTTFPATCTACGEYWEHEDGRGPTGPCRETETGTHAFPARPLGLAPAVFSIEGDPSAPTFKGWHDPRNRWNGWANPYFTRETVERVVAQMLQDGAELTFDWDGDVLLVTDEQYGNDTERVSPLVVDGVALYGMGLGWVWDTVETPDDDA